MNTEDIIRMAREAYGTATWLPDELARFVKLAYEAGAAKEREARQAAQIENEELKARRARAGLEQQRAVLAEREACAKVCESLPMQQEIDVRDECAAAIRARKDNT
jgi:hypothetical protein